MDKNIYDDEYQVVKAAHLQIRKNIAEAPTQRCLQATNCALRYRQTSSRHR